ncbi:MAG: PH domain-containing protein [Candidatus Nanosalina sp.]
MRKPEKKIQLLWAVTLAAFLLVLGTFTTLAEIVFPSIPSGYAGVFLGVLLISGLLYINRAYAAWGFEVRDDHLYIQHGVFTKVKSMVPFVRMQHVDTQRNFIERIFGLSTVVVYTAGSRGSDVQVKGLLPEDASRIQEKLRDVAIESEDRDAV